MIRPYSSPEEWPYKEHTGFKHDLLSNYLTLWGVVLGRPRYGRKRVMHYVDCFAASGRYSNDRPGSPIIAMEVGQKLHERHEDCFLECHFIEQDEATYNMLRWELEVAGVDFPDVWVRTYQGRFEDKIDKIFAEVGDREPALVFLDPFRIMELKPIIQLLSRRWSEILVTFMSSFTNRFIGSQAQEFTWDTKFGTGSWRKLLGQPNRQEEIVDFYGREIQAQAREQLMLEDVLVYPIPVRGHGRTSNIYHLIHISRHPKARLTMERAAAKTVMLEQDPLPLFTREVEENVLDKLATGRPVHALELAGRVWYDHWTVSWPEIKQAILDLESSNLVGVRARDGRKRRRGLEEKDLVFLRGR